MQVHTKRVRKRISICCLLLGALFECGCHSETVNAKIQNPFGTEHNQLLKKKTGPVGEEQGQIHFNTFFLPFMVKLGADWEQSQSEPIITNRAGEIFPPDRIPETDWHDVARAAVFVGVSDWPAKPLPKSHQSGSMISIELNPSYPGDLSQIQPSLMTYRKEWLSGALGDLKLRDDTPDVKLMGVRWSTFELDGSQTEKKRSFRFYLARISGCIIEIGVGYPSVTSSAEVDQRLTSTVSLGPPSEVGQLQKLDRYARLGVLNLLSTEARDQSLGVSMLGILRKHTLRELENVSYTLRRRYCELKASLDQHNRLPPERVPTGERTDAFGNRYIVYSLYSRVAVNVEQEYRLVRNGLSLISAMRREIEKAPEPNPQAIELLLSTPETPYEKAYALHRAIKYGDTQEALKLIESGADLAVLDNEVEGWTVLHAATYWAHPEIVTALLKKGCDPNAVISGTSYRPLDVLVSNTPDKPLDSELHFFMNSSVKDPRTIKCIKLIWDAGGRGAMFQRVLQSNADLGDQEAINLQRMLK